MLSENAVLAMPRHPDADLDSYLRGASSYSPKFLVPIVASVPVYHDDWKSRVSKLSVQCREDITPDYKGKPDFGGSDDYTEDLASPAHVFFHCPSAAAALVCALPVVCAGTPSVVHAALVATLYQRFIWELPAPLIGLVYRDDAPTLDIVIGWYGGCPTTDSLVCVLILLALGPELIHIRHSLKFTSGIWEAALDSICYAHWTPCPYAGGFYNFVARQSS